MLTSTITNGGGEMTWQKERAKITDALTISIDADIKTILKKIEYLETIRIKYNKLTA